MYNSETLWCIIYVSQSTEIQSIEDMEICKEKIKKDCLSKGYSGIMVHTVGKTLCLIEGKKTKIFSVLNEVKRSLGHYDISVKYDGAISFRYFEDYGFMFNFLQSKAYQKLDDFAAIEDNAYLNDYLNECLAIKHIAMKRIKEFITYNRNTYDFNSAPEEIDSIASY